MKADFSITCLVLSVLVLTGCAINQPKFKVEVDSFRSADSEEKSYLLLPGKEDVMDDDLQFKEYSGYVHRALSMKGFVPAESFEKANVAIFLSYGIGDPQEHRLSYSIPTRSRTVFFSPYFSRRSSSYGRHDSNSGAKAYRQPYGIPGGASDVVTYTTHFRYIVLDAFDLRERRKSDDEVRLWRTAVKSTGTSDDLRRVFPILLAASQPYIATNTGERVEAELDESDAQVVAIRGVDEEADKE